MDILSFLKLIGSLGQPSLFLVIICRPKSVPDIFSREGKMSSLLDCLTSLSCVWVELAGVMSGSVASGCVLLLVVSGSCVFVVELLPVARLSICCEGGLLGRMMEGRLFIFSAAFSSVLKVPGDMEFIK